MWKEIHINSCQKCKFREQINKIQLQQNNNKAIWSSKQWLHLISKKCSGLPLHLVYLLTKEKSLWPLLQFKKVYLYLIILKTVLERHGQWECDVLYCG